MHHFLEQFGPALDLPWTHLKGPALTDELIERIVTQSDAQAAGRTVPAAPEVLTRLREITDAQAGLGMPEAAGRGIAMPAAAASTT